MLCRYKTITGMVPSDRELSSLIETGESESIFKKAILEHGRGQVGGDESNQSNAGGGGNFWKFPPNQRKGNGGRAASERRAPL